MPITKEVIFDQITVIQNGIVQLRTATTFLDDGVELAKTYHRTSFTPGQDVSDQPANVQAVCASVWTPEIVSEYQASRAQ